MSNPKAPQTIQEGFNKFVIRNDDGCWNWAGCVPKNGYPQFRFQMKRERAHRASWLLHYGDIPENMHVLHRCDNKRCSRPDHLFLGTRADNMRDMLKKGYHPTLGKKHEDNHRAILCLDKVKQIKSLIDIGKSMKKIADIFNVSVGAIANIRYGNTWKGV